jgi:hypothetical protein
MVKQPGMDQRTKQWLRPDDLIRFGANLCPQRINGSHLRYNLLHLSAPLLFAK